MQSLPQAAASGRASRSRLPLEVPSGFVPDAPTERQQQIRTNLEDHRHRLTCEVIERYAALRARGLSATASFKIIVAEYPGNVWAHAAVRRAVRAELRQVNAELRAALERSRMLDAVWSAQERFCAPPRCVPPYPQARRHGRSSRPAARRTRGSRRCSSSSSSSSASRGDPDPGDPPRRSSRGCR